MTSRERPTGTVRKLFHTDAEAFLAHLKRLDAEGRRARFAMAVSDDFLARYVETSFRLGGVTLGWFEDRALRAVAELRPIADLATAEVEVAFSVEPAWRRRGIASRLFGELIEVARNRGIRRLYSTCLGSNRAMQGLALKFDGQLEMEGGDVMGIVPAPERAPFGPAREAMGDMVGFATVILDLQRRMLTGRR